MNTYHIDNQAVEVKGKWTRMAVVQDEEWLQDEPVRDPEAFILKIKDSRVPADVFTFAQKLPKTQPEYSYYMEWDNVAAIHVNTYKDWWENRLPQVTRKSIRRAAKRGAFAEVVEFNDKLVEGIIEIHNDTMIRQGSPFTHYGKEFEVVKKEYGTFMDRSEFIGSYFEEELIGIIKVVYLNNAAHIMQILSKTKHYDKRPTNIIIAKAVELCEAKKIPFLVYGKFVYGNKVDSSLTEFKRRNGFEQIDIPRYYVPLTLKGKIILKLKLHRGLLGILPNRLINMLRRVRTAYYRAIKIPLVTKGGDREADIRRESNGRQDKDPG